MSDHERRLHIALAMIIRYANDEDYSDDFDGAITNAKHLLSELPPIGFIPEYDDSWIDETNGDYYDNCVRQPHLVAYLIATCVLSETTPCNSEESNA